MNQKAMALLVMAAFIVSTLSVPIALADESVVGIVYRGWSDQECKAAFGNYPYIISNVDDLGLTDPKLKDARGPLLYQGQESGCFCGREPNANQPAVSRDYIMSEEKTSCVMCSRYDRNAVYYTDGNATDAVVKVKDKDVGCRCASMEGNKAFDKYEGGKCLYKDKTADNNRCQAQYGTSGVRVCTSTSGETQLGMVSGITCCCEPNFEKLLDATKPGGYNCTGTGRSATSAVCVNEGKSRGMMEGVDECPSDLKGVLTNPSATQEQKDRFNMLFAFSTSTTQCCCGTGYLFSGGKCLKDVDECGQIVPGSVKQGRSDAGTTKVGDAYGSKRWETNKTEAIQKKGLACYCKKSYIPMDSIANPKKAGGAEEDVYVLDSCSGVSTCGQAALGSVPSTDANADPGIKVGPGWEQSIINTITTLNLECSCPKGTIAYNTPGSPDPGNDVCAFADMRCMDATALSNFMYVGVCNSQMNDAPMSIDFSEKGPVGIVDSVDFSVKNIPRRISDIVGGVLYGVYRGMGIRDIWGGIKLLKGCDKPASKDDFPGYVRYMACLSNYPCDQMPTDTSSRELFESGLFKMGGQVYYDTLRELKYADTVLATKWTKDIGGITAKLQEAGKSLAYTGEMVTHVKVEATSNFAKFRSIYDHAEFVAAQKDIRQIYFPQAGGGATTTAEKIAEATKSIAELEKDMKVAGVPNADIAKVITKLTDGVKEATDQLTAARGVIASVGNKVDDLQELATMLKSTAPHGITVESLATATSKISGKVAKATDEIGDVARAAKTGSRWWNELVKSKGVTTIGKIEKVPVFNVVGKITGKSLKFAGRLLGLAGLAYSMADGLTGAISRIAATDIDLTPGETLYGVDTDKPFVVKSSVASGSGYDKLYAVKILNINLNGGAAFLRGMIDLRFTSDTLTSPPPIEGITYKCMCGGSASCGSDNKLTGCTCYPISNTIDVQVSSKTTITLSGI